MMRRCVVAGVSALAAMVAATSVAAASSIVFVKDGNVFVAGPDGSGVRQVASDGVGSGSGAYGSPSQADDGTIWAVRGTRLYRFAPDGSPVGAVPSILTDAPSNIYGFGPWDARVSPDGQTVAYDVGFMARSYNPASDAIETTTSDNIVWARAGDGGVFGFTRFYETPAWLPDSQHALLWEPPNRGVAQVVVAGIGQNHNDTPGWFKDTDTLPGEPSAQDVGPGELTRSGGRLAAVRIGAGQTIQLYDARNGFGSPPVPVCYIDSPHGRFANPTWSPDGSQLAYADEQGIWVTPVGSAAAMAGGDCSALAPRPVIPGGFQPDWGPADPVPRSILGSDGGGGGGTGPGGGPHPGGGSGPGHVAPRISALSITRGRIPVIRFRLSERAAVTIIASRRRTVFVQTVRGQAGINQVRVRRLRRGTYRLTVRASDATGLTSAPVVRRLVIGGAH